MVATVNSRPEESYLLIEGTGSIENADDEKTFSSSCYEEIQKHGSKRVLVDQRNISFKSSILDQCDVVSHYSTEFDVMIRATRIAVLVLPESEELHAFWEVYANNRGYPWKVYTEMEDAIGFLTAPLG